MNICVNNVVGFSAIISSIFGNNLVINESHDLFMTDYVIVLNMVFDISC